MPVIKSIGEEREKGKEERCVLTKRRDPSTAELCYSAQDDKRSEATAKRKGRERNEQRGRGENLLLQLQ